MSSMETLVRILPIEEDKGKDIDSTAYHKYTLDLTKTPILEQYDGLRRGIEHICEPAVGSELIAKCNRAMTSFMNYLNEWRLRSGILPEFSLEITDKGTYYEHHFIRIK